MNKLKVLNLILSVVLIGLTLIACSSTTQEDVNVDVTIKKSNIELAKDNLKEAEKFENHIAWGRANYYMQQAIYEEELRQTEILKMLLKR